MSQRIDEEWYGTLKKLLSETECPKTVDEAVEDLAYLGIDVDEAKEILAKKREEWKKDEAMQTKFKELGLGEDFLEFALGIHAYTLKEPAIYKAVSRILYNPTKRLDTDSPEVRAAVKFAKFINEGLPGLPSYDKLLVVYRGIEHVFEDFAELFADGTVFARYTLTSASKDPKVAEEFCGKRGTIFKITLKAIISKFKDISWLSAYPKEKEVLAPLLTMLQVIGSKGDPDSHPGQHDYVEVKEEIDVRKLLELDPQNAKAWEAYGDAGGGKVIFPIPIYTQAECYCESLRLDAKNAIAWCKLGKLSGGTVGDEECCAKECFMRSLSLDPTNAEAWNRLGDLGGGTGYHFDIHINCNKQQCYETCLENDPMCPDAWKELGGLGGATVSNKPCSQQECYGYVLQLEPGNWEVWHSLGKVGGGKVGDKDYDVVQCYEKSLQLNPENADAWCDLGGAGGGKVGDEDYDAKECFVKTLEHADLKHARAWRSLGKLGVRGEQYDAKQCYGKSLGLNREDAEVWEEFGDVGGGKVVGEVMEYSVARCYCESLRLDSKNATAWFKLGKLGGGKVGDEECSAKECLIRSLSLDPSNAEAWKRLGIQGGGRVRYHFDDDVNAFKDYTEKECYEKCLDKNNMDAEAWLRLGNCGGGCVKDQDWKHHECWEFAAELNPAYADAVGHALVRCGTVDKSYNAAKRIAKVLEKKESADLWYYLGIEGGGQVGGKKYTNKECFVKSAEMDPQSAKAWCALGIHFYSVTIGSKGYTDQECLARCLELDPTFDGAWAALATIGMDDVSVNGKKYTKEECRAKAVRARAVERDPTNPDLWDALGDHGGRWVDGFSCWFFPKTCWMKAAELRTAAPKPSAEPQATAESVHASKSQRQCLAKPRRAKQRFAAPLVGSALATWALAAAGGGKLKPRSSGGGRFQVSGAWPPMPNQAAAGGKVVVHQGLASRVTPMVACRRLIA